MKADPRFSNRPDSFWGNVRKLSEQIGYAQKDCIIVPGFDKMLEVYQKMGLPESLLKASSGQPTTLGKDLIAYFEYRANVLNTEVCGLLMDVKEAMELFDYLKAKLKPSCPLPMNKQKEDKQQYAYFTCIINMIIESSLKKHSTPKRKYQCDFDPRSLPFFFDDKGVTYTLSRRVDGAYPALNNPVAVWEIKEYYHTTTFGSRVADGIYETVLDGFELNSVRNAGHTCALHYLMVDAKDAWWKQGKSYLCRIIDLLNMGLVNEVLFGREVSSRLPEIVDDWVNKS